MRRCAVTLVVLGVCTVSLLAWHSAAAQITKGKTRPAATKFLMRGINQPNCAGVAKLLKETPGDDKTWETIACHASCLNEMSFILMEDGRCPDAAWANGAKALREGSAALLAAAGKKDIEAARAAFKTLTEGCATCHNAHRKK